MHSVLAPARCSLEGLMVQTGAQLATPGRLNFEVGGKAVLNATTVEARIVGSSTGLASCAQLVVSSMVPKDGKH